MESRAVLFVAASLAALLAVASACSGPNPAALTLEEREGSSGEPGGPGGPGPGTDGGGGGTGPGPGKSDGGGSSGEEDPIFGTTTFSYVAPTKTANDVPNHSGSVSGKDCITGGCHLDNSHKWVFAGTVYSAAKNGTPVAKAEVRIVGPDGTALGSAYTDANGNFWFDKAGAAIAENSKVGVRKEGGEPIHMAMALKSTDKGCNANRANCHGTSAQGNVYAP